MNGKAIILKYFSVFALAAGVASGAVTLVSADDDEKGMSVGKSAGTLRLEQLLTQLKPMLGGEILKVEKEYEHGRLVYEVKYIDASGYVREIYVDARSGEIVAEEDD